MISENCKWGTRIIMTKDAIKKTGWNKKCGWNIIKTGIFVGFSGKTKLSICVVLNGQKSVQRWYAGYWRILK